MEIPKTPAFKQYFIDSDIYRSYVKLQGTPFLTTLDMAKKGNSDARNALFYIAFPAINSVFFKNFIGNKSYRKDRIQQGDDFVFLSEAYLQMFKNQPQSPLNTFKPSPDKSEVYNINGFLYYVTQYLKNHAIRLNKATIKQNSEVSMSSDSEDEDNDNLSYNKEDYISLKNSVNLTSFTDEIDIQNMFIKYLAILKNRPNKMEYNLLILKAKGKPLDEIAETLKVSKAWVYELIKKTKAEFLSLMEK